MGAISFYLRLSFVACAALLASCASVSRNLAYDGPAPQDVAAEQLRANGFSHAFVDEILNRYRVKERDRIIEANSFGFLEKGDYSGHYNPKALKKCAEFIKLYRRTLGQAEKRYGVRQEVIAALLWVETKYGTDPGKNLLTEVYFSLLQSEHPVVFAKTVETMKAKYGDRATKGAEASAKARAKKNAERALAELQALQTIYAKKGRHVLEMRGSYAGAFGMPQFIPSSYLQWAVSNTPPKAPDLYKPQDAIMSVANYLKTNGWDENNPKGQQEALFHYNHAQGYVDVILKIAAEVKARR